jgi:acetolactate synthase-1/2/3 large subunit
VGIARNFKAQRSNTELLDKALATMWAGYATAMEAKRLNSDSNVVCITWDGGLVMNLWDIETAVRLKLHMTIVVLNNSSYWMIKWKQEHAWFKDFWLDFWNPDFVKLAESFWAKWYKVINKNDFKETLKKSLSVKWLKIIDLDFDYPVDGEIK